MFKQKQFFGVVILALIAGLVFINWASIKAALGMNAKAAGGATPVPGGGSAPAPTGTTGTTPYTPTISQNDSTKSAASKGLNMSVLLKNGVRGNEVAALQVLLNRFTTIDQLKVDSIFGPATEARLAQYTGFRQITLQQASEEFYKRYRFYYTF